MANPPAPDVEAVARQYHEQMPLAKRIIAHSRADDDPRHPDVILVDELALRGRIVEALATATAHTASLQARVEELERERDILTTGGIIEVAVRNLNVRHYMDHWEGRVAKAEAEANRMREALESARRLTGGGDTEEAYTVLCWALQPEHIRAALRPADEPVTQDDDLPSIQDVRGILRSDR